MEQAIRFQRHVERKHAGLQPSPLIKKQTAMTGWQGGHIYSNKKCAQEDGEGTERGAPTLTKAEAGSSKANGNAMANQGDI